MYICRHCGLEYMTDEAVMCPRCQAPKGKGTNFCPFCGTQVTGGQEICTNCGVEMSNYGVTAVKSKIAAGLLAVFLGEFGVHNFYLGYIKKAAIQLILMISSYIVMFGSVFSIMASDYFFMPHRTIYGFIAPAIIAVLLAGGVRIWSFIEGILIFCGKIKKDGKGRSLK